MIVVNDSGIYIANGKGATITMIGTGDRLQPRRSDYHMRRDDDAWFASPRECGHAMRSRIQAQVIADPAACGRQRPARSHDVGQVVVRAGVPSQIPSGRPKPQPCVLVKWAMPSTRVLVVGQPADAVAVTGTRARRLPEPRPDPQRTADRIRCTAASRSSPEEGGR